MRCKLLIVLSVVVGCVLLPQTAAAGHINVTMCGNQPQDGGLPQCTSNCTSFVIADGACTAALGLNQTIRCGATKVQCFDYSVYNSDNCDPDTEMLVARAPCDDCFFDEQLRCTKDALEPYRCNEHTNCSTNCTQRGMAPLKKCVQINDTRHRNQGPTSVLLKRFYQCRPVYCDDYNYGSNGCSSDIMFQSATAEHHCLDGASVNNQRYAVTFSCLDSSTVDASKVVKELPHWAQLVMRAASKKGKIRFN